MGAGSHIAKGLINNFLLSGSYELFLFTRNRKKAETFIRSLGKEPGANFVNILEGYQDFSGIDCDVIINCVGAGVPNKLGSAYRNWFLLTEKFDNLAISRLLEKPDIFYVNFSSGAVYGGKDAMPARKDSVNTLRVNDVPAEEYYSVVRLNSEFKHRAFEELRIVDLRIFSYFSRFIDLNSGYFISELVKSVKEHQTLRTSPVNTIRDYISPEDLFSLIEKCIRCKHLNTAIDVASRAPVEKFKILDYFSREYGLQYVVDDTMILPDPNKTSEIYFSEYKNAEELGFTPSFTSMETIGREAEYILNI